MSSECSTLSLQIITMNYEMIKSYLFIFKDRNNSGENQG